MSVLYEIGINVLGGIISAVIVLVVLGIWQAKSDLRWRLLRLRNILFDVETSLDPQYHTTRTAEGVRIAESTVEPAEWLFWRYESLNVRETLFEIAERRFARRLLKSHYHVERASAIDHFQRINSIFARQPSLSKYLGIIECTSDAINLLSQARDAANELHCDAERWRALLATSGANQNIRDTSHYEEQLEAVRQRIKLHREHIEERYLKPLMPKKKARPEDKNSTTTT